ncbi:uncharacterized protein LOC132307382 [Cornus florida]|uniref:uncharacterized protein LOC132307382 n=1 Tax=Cornus florida TaxID=4283 RepID=UPI00289F2780|nr:uncharacterized protein LOC132307382 [Cornus florida]
MAFEVPTDLIRQVQISLREDAGLSSYDPQDPTLPALPSLAGSIAGFDPSPPDLRCKNCKGRLVRGLQSVICVYCGNQQLKEVTPDPIAFKSTFGYRWLLQSLDLDESETIGPPIEGNESNRGKSSGKDEISLSDLLNLQIIWPAESEKPGTSFTNKVLVQDQSSLNLTGADVDNFFPEPRQDTVSNATEKQPVKIEQFDNIKASTFVDQENISLFLNAQPSETAVRSHEDVKGEQFSGWADFQSAGSGNQHEGSKSFDPFEGSTIDLSSHMDSVFGTGKDLKDGKPGNDSHAFSSVTNDLIQDDVWNNLNSTVSHQAEQFDATMKAEGSVTADNLNNPSSSGDWLQDDQWQTSSTNAPGNKALSKEGDSFDGWNDFASLTSAQDSSKDSSNRSDNHTAPFDEQTSEINLSSSTNNFQEMDFGSFSQPDLFSGSSSNQIGNGEVNKLQLKVPASDRMADTKNEVGENVGQAAKDGDVPSATTQTKDDAENLFSQMHDLSFMLKNNLSVPSKSDGLSSFSQD